MAAKPLIVALLFLAAFIPAGVWFILDWVAKRRDPARLIVERLAQLERDAEALRHAFREAGLEDYPGGPRTVADDDERPFRSSER